MIRGMTSHITSLTIVYWSVYSGVDKKNIKAPCHWPLWGEFTDDWWIPRTNGQKRGKCFHFMTSSWNYIKLSLSYLTMGDGKSSWLLFHSFLAQKSRWSFVLHPTKYERSIVGVCLVVIISPLLSEFVRVTDLSSSQILSKVWFSQCQWERIPVATFTSMV